jgi:hypothetical protein
MLIRHPRPPLHGRGAGKNEEAPVACCLSAAGATGAACCVCVCVSSVAVECSCVHEAAESGVYSTLYLGPESRVRDGAYLNTSVTSLDWDFASSQSPNHATIFQVCKYGNGLNTNNSTA